MAASRAVSFDGRPTTESGLDVLLIVIDGESIQLAMKVETIPEKSLVEIFAPKSADEALYERVRARREREGVLSNNSNCAVSGRGAGPSSYRSRAQIAFASLLSSMLGAPFSNPRWTRGDHQFSVGEFALD